MARWMVVDRGRTPIVTGVLIRDTAERWVAFMEDQDPDSGPYRVVRDIVAESLADES
jgi:hypothetical protein